MNQEDKIIAESIFNTASIVLAEKGEISPMYFLVKDKKVNPIVGHPGITVQELANAAVNFANEWDAEAMILLCEQWMIQMAKDSEDLKEYLDGTKRPSQSPDAEVYLTLTFVTKDGETNSLIAKVHKSLNGVRYVRETKWIDDTVTNMITPWA